MLLFGIGEKITLTPTLTENMMMQELYDAAVHVPMKRNVN